MVLQSFNVEGDIPRLVMLGNSNVGKSSVVKYLLTDKKLATGAIGKHAGSTVSLKLYDDRNLPYQIIDMPGFGVMTRTSKKMQDKIYDKIIQYVEGDRGNIFLALVIINAIRVEDELKKWYYENKKTIPLSYEFVMWLNDIGLPSIVVLNKIDKLKKYQLRNVEKEIHKVIYELGVPIVGFDAESGLLEILKVSTKNGKNMKTLRRHINQRYQMIFS